MKFPRLLIAATIFAALPAEGQCQAHVTTEPIAKDGTPLNLDLPKSLHMRNTGGSDGPRGPGSGSGLCVWTSINHTAYWQSIPELYELQKRMMQKPGGGWPARVDSEMTAIFSQLGTPRPDIVQIEMNDLDLLAQAVKRGRMPGVTYARSPTGRYQGKKIAHMVTLVGARVGNGPDGKGWWVVLDNNYPGSFEWMSESQFLACASGGGRLWAVLFLGSGPGLVPVN